MSSTSSVVLRIIQESLFGITPTTGNGRELAFTGESLDYTLAKEQSQNINAYRGVTSVSVVGGDANGSVNVEMRYGEYDQLLAGLLQGAWAPFGTNGVGASAALTITPTTITAATAPTGTSAFTNLKPGQWFRLRGAPLNSKRLFRVSSTTAPTSTVITLDAGTPAVAEAPAAGIIVTSRVRNGVAQPSFTLEKDMSDTTEFIAYKGMTPATFSLNMATRALTTGEFSFLGKEAEARTATIMPGTTRSSLDYESMSGVSGDVCVVWANGAPLTGTYVNSLSLSYDNSLAVQDALCSVGAIGVRNGDIVLTLDMDIYFMNGNKFYSEFLNNTNLELAFSLIDKLGNGYVFTIPRANVTTHTVQAAGKNQDLMASIQFTALVDMSPADAARKGAVLFIDRVGDAVLP